LRAEGFDIDYVFVSGLRNREAREIYATADIIVDQLLLGCYGMFAVEGMALGKPVVSYLAADVIAANPTYPSCPIVIAEPHDITDRLRELVSSPELRRSLGERSRRYAEKFHSPSFTGRVLAAIALRVWLGKASADPRRLVDEAVAA
jgi:glycosyltransferase involved in cell wall biosynthesis